MNLEEAQKEYDDIVEEFSDPDLVSDLEKFEELNLRPELHKAVHRLGFVEATEIQAKCIPLWKWPPSADIQLR